MAIETITIEGRANMIEIEEALDRTGLKMSQLTSHMKKNFMVFDKNRKIVDDFSGDMMKTTQVMKQAGLQARRFKFEWLSIMFAGMAMDRAFGGLMRTQMQLFGVTDMMSSAWTIVLLPVMELITPLLYKMLELFMAMPTPLKYLVGIFVLFGAILGGIMLLGGQIMLFLGGLKVLTGATGVAGSFKILGSWIAKAFGGKVLFLVAKFSAVLGGIILIVMGIYNIIKGKFEGIGQIIMGVGLILLLFIGWWALIPIAVGAAVYLIIKHWDKVKSFFSNVWREIKIIFSRAWEAIKVIFFKATVVGVIIKNWEKIKSFFSGLWDWLKKGFKKIVRWLEDLWEDSIIGQATSLVIKGLGKLKGFQAGGLVAKTGPAFLHAGERVIPKGRTGSEVIFAPTVYVDATINSEMDLRVLASKLNEYWAKDFERIAQGRGI